VDGPTTGVPRHSLPIKRAQLTSLKLNIMRGQRHGKVR